MTEAEWLACTDLEPMLQHLRSQVSDRKMRLYLCAGCRGISHLFYEPASLAAVEVAERFADGEATKKELRRAEWDAEAPTFGSSLAPGPGGLSFDSEPRIKIFPRLIEMGALPSAVVPGEEWQINDAVRERLLSAAEIAWHCALLTPFDESGFLFRHISRVDWPSRWLIDCVFGNPFRRRSIDPLALAWNDGTVPRIAQGIYVDRAFGRMPILHDALLDAGCTDEVLLTHCRNPEGHVLGCWALDLILDKK